MPVEIRELVLRVTVEDRAAASSRTAHAPVPEAADAWVAECVEQVLEILRQREER